MQDDLDLRPYLRVIARQWRWILMLALVAGVVAAVWTATRPPSYSASVWVLVRSSQSQLTLDERFETTELVDVGTRRRTLLELARSSAIEARIPAEQRASLGHQAQGELAGRIQVSADADLVEITARAPDPQQARNLANVWASTYVHYINELFSPAGAAAETGAEEQIRAARERYNVAQGALEDFLAESQIDTLDARITATHGVISATQGVYLARHREYLAVAQQLELVLRDAEALRREIASGESAGTNASLAALLIRARASVGPDFPIELQLDPLQDAGQDRGVTLDELDAFIASLQQQISETEVAAAELGDALASHRPVAGSRLTPAQQAGYFEELADLRRQREAEVGQLRALELERDIALEALQVVQRKVTEEQVTAARPEPQVRVASEAALLGRPAAQPMILNSVAAALASVVLGSLVALLLHMLRLPLVPARQQSNIDQRANSASSG